MVNTTWDERRSIEERVANGGRLTVEECRALIEDADAGEQAGERLTALEAALQDELGLRCVDMTTDDDEGTALALVPVEAEAVPYA